jgi:hypothetical protein
LQDDLTEVDHRHIVKEVVSDNRSFVELVWRERLPLGMNLLMNDASGGIKIIDFPRGSQARAVCEARQLDAELFKGSKIVAVNGCQYEYTEELFDALKDPTRPKTVRFQLVSVEESERVRRFVEGTAKKPSNDDVKESARVFHLRKVDFSTPGEIGIEFRKSFDNFGLVVERFTDGDGGVVLAAERSARIKKGDLLVMVNDQFVGSTGEAKSQVRAVELLAAAAAKRPLSLTFAEQYIHSVLINKAVGDNDDPNELKLVEQNTVGQPRKIVIKGFEDVAGRAEASGIFIGDHLVFLNGEPVGLGCSWLGVLPVPTMMDVQEKLGDARCYPMGLTFARPLKQNENRWSSSMGPGLFRDDQAQTISVAVDSKEQLGCIFQQPKDSDTIVVADFQSCPGIFQRALRVFQDSRNNISLSVSCVNGQYVPSYASASMVKSAIGRSLKAENKVELWLVDDQLKEWIYTHSKE